MRVSVESSESTMAGEVKGALKISGVAPKQGSEQAGMGMSLRMIWANHPSPKNP